MNACDVQKKTEPMISVIIPVYCAQATLRESLDSVLSQSVSQLEVICVDDGSTDDSVSILREYAAKDSRVHVLTQTNQFAGAARNRGMDAAAGKYIAFLDADDVYLPGSLEAMYRQAEQYRLDMLKTGFVYENVTTGERYQDPYAQNSTVGPRQRERVLALDRLPEQLLSVADVPWNGLYRRQFLLENDIRFNHLRCVNDHSFFIHCLLKARRIMVSDIAAVCYRVGSQSSLVGRRAEHFNDQVASYQIVRELCRREAPRRAPVVLRMELTILFQWYERLRPCSKHPEQLDGIMKEFVSGLDEADTGVDFLRSFSFKERYYSMRYGMAAPERRSVVRRLLSRWREYGLIYVLKNYIRRD